MIESHTLSVRSVADEPLPEYLDNRYRLHADLVAAIEDQDARRALDLLLVHNAPAPEDAAAAATPGAVASAAALAAPATAGGPGTSE